MDTNLYSKNLWRTFLYRKWPIYILGIFSVLLTNIFQILSPKSVGWIIDFLMGKEVPTIFLANSHQQTFVNLFIFLVLTRIFVNIFRFLWRITLARQTHYSAAFLRSEVWNHARFFKKEDVENKYTKGVLMSAGASDANIARNVFGFTLVAIADVVFLGVFTFLAMLLINSKLAIVSFAVLLFVPLVVKKISQNEVGQYQTIQNALSRFNDLSSQVVSTIKLQKITQTSRFWEKRLREESSQYRLKKLKGSNLNLLYVPVMGAASILSYVILFVIGIQFIFEKLISIGDFVSLVGLIFLMHDPLMSLGFVVSEWRKGFTALNRLSDIYRSRHDEVAHNLGECILDFKNFNGPILSVANLSLAYDNDNMIFKNLNFTIHKGDRVGIKGRIGSGKSSLLMILSGINQNVTQGEVLFYGQPFKNFSHSDLHRYIGIASQKPFLFADTIRANVLLDSNYSDDDILSILDVVELKNDVLSFPDQLDTQLGEWGINLSGGQKQRLSLARVLIRRPQLLFLDDCLSAVDTVTEERILEKLNIFFQDTTIVWVAHRNSTLRFCNKYIEL